ncbi:MAG: MgtC/SapB family protein [Candidatus Omnitrophica bacterium]|nr:MgtC/SapB family protein [Candidatus Omnitrophota bacterium]
MYSTLQSCTEVFLKLFCAALFAGIIGMEREIQGRAAGLRTHILVSVGSCFIMWTSINFFHVYKDVATCDPSRIAAGVVTGIGFLGAGTILRYRASVIGLTTAASIWAVSAIGLGVGVGFYWESFIATIMVFLTLFIVSKMELVFTKRLRYKELVIEAKADADKLSKIREVLEKYKAVVKDFEVEKNPYGVLSKLLFDIKLTTEQYNDIIIFDLMEIDGVEKARWE